MTALRNPGELLRRIRAVHEAIRDEVLSACLARSSEDLSQVVGDDAGDTLFAIDRVSESVLLDRFAELAREWPCLLVAEGLGQDGRTVLPRGTAASDVEIVVLVDPIDGTRGLMYQKRSAWILTGVAPACERQATLADLQLAVQTEIPLIKQHLSDTLWAAAGEGAWAERYDRLTGVRRPLVLRPSRASTIEQGYGGLARFFPGGRELLAAVDDSVVERVLGPAPEGRAQTFEDQYICTGGQLYELAIGHDRWIADLRPLVGALRRAQGRPPTMCCHPYDLCTELVAREAGVIVTGPSGDRLSAPLDVFTDVAWVGYANRSIREQVEPALLAALEERGLLARR
jgi:fructose-1,6-bisphosphatase/inositol monophosphatase family enzyme